VHFSTLSGALRRLVQSAQFGTVLLIACTVLALVLANSPYGAAYEAVWAKQLGPLSISHWINDGLMAIFFLLIGLELERELYVGELAELRKALLPIFAAIGGMLIPAGIHFAFNSGTPGQAGFGIPMATDIAFVLGALAVLRSRVPLALKIFVVAYAVIDDLGAIVIIAIFYTAQLSIPYVLGALGVWGALLLLNVRFRVTHLAPYLIGGAILWTLLLNSGVHATLAGVMLAFAVPFSSTSGPSPSFRMEHNLHRPTALFVLPIFALANAGVQLPSDVVAVLQTPNALGIYLGLVAGKPLGVIIASMMAVRLGVCALPDSVSWRHIAGAGFLGGIGFTMSIFIANLAFPGDSTLIDGSKLAVFAASVTAAILAIAWLWLSGDRLPGARLDESRT